MGKWLRAVIAVVALSASTGAMVAEAVAQAITDDGSTYRQRRDDQRDNARRTVGERSLQRTTSEREARRRLLELQRNQGAASRRSTPVLPKNNASSVVVTQ